MQAQLTKETTTYVHCPSCENKCSTVDHLTDGFVSSWVCENCGVMYDIKMEEGIISVSSTNKINTKKFVFFKNSNIGLIVKITSFDSEQEQMQYFYDEHTCPINYMSNVIAVINLETGDDDPHGIFEYCGSSDYPADYSESDYNYNFRKMIPWFGLENKLLNK